jgi:glucose-6-phosphate 1-dehydrogenase
MSKPTLLVLFGITGDLSQRKLLPALHQIISTSSHPDSFHMLGVTRQAKDLADILDPRHTALPGQITVHTNGLCTQSDFELLRSEINNIVDSWIDYQVIFYLSVPPANTRSIAEGLSSVGLNEKHVKLLMEKPFGYDLASAEDLNNHLSACFDEDQIYRVDHYLAKEMAQNILTFRRSNPMFWPTWSGEHIDKVEVIATEKIGIEGRGNFYEQTGAMRDFVQSHLLQLVSLVLMDVPPDSTSSELIYSRLVAQSSLQIASKNGSLQATRAQYEGYKDEAQSPISNIETFVHLELASSLENWQNVPIYITTGKAMHDKITEVVITFKAPADTKPNKLRFRIYPREGVDIDIAARVPGYDHRVAMHSLDFEYNTQTHGRQPDAYEQVIIDAIRGEKFLFASAEESLTGWRIIQPALDIWTNNSDIEIYKPGAYIDDITNGTKTLSANHT